MVFTDLRVRVGDTMGRRRTLVVEEFTIRRPSPTVKGPDPVDDRIGDPGGYDDVVVRWCDTGLELTATEWEHCREEIFAALDNAFGEGR